MAKDTYDELLIHLGDLARERLGDRPNPSAAMVQVFAAEDEVLAIREEKAALDRKLNEEDEQHRDFLAGAAAERAEQQQIVKKWKRAVEGVETRSAQLRKQIATAKTAIGYDRVGLERAEQKHAELEQAQAHHHEKVESSKGNLKKLRLTLMRKGRDLEELEAEYRVILTPTPGQPGAQGILAHKRLLELEDEREARELAHAAGMKQLDEQLGALEDSEKEAEAALEDAIFALGDECYRARLADPALAAVYPRLDKAR